MPLNNVTLFIALSNKIKWEGTSPELSDAGIIKYTNDLGTISESAPVSFLSTGINLSSRFKINSDHSVSFEIESYSEDKTLIIDPTMNWATYYGGTGGETGFGNCTDVNGNQYINGSTNSTSGIATSGSFQSAFAGGLQDAFLAKFSSNGALIWATYYGGSADDYAYGISIDTSGNIIIVGHTDSGYGIATSGAYQTTNAGNSDAFLAKFNSSGSRIYATYFGGPSGENCRAIFTDIEGNIYIGGNTSSTTGIATSGAFQTSNAGGLDGYCAKFNDTGAVQWATYYGGSGDETVRGITGNNNGSIFITGSSTSTSGISTSGAYQSSNAGADDGFIAKFNSSTGIRIWGTYYGGIGSDVAAGICSYDTGSVCITGNTGSTNGIATSGAYQSYLAGSPDVFIAKFSGAGNIQWGTYFGGSNGESVLSISSNKSGGIYITGQTSSTGMATSGSFQTSLGGGSDALISRFNANGNLVWSSYYGGSSNDAGLGIHAGDSGNVYVMGNTHSTSNIATSGAYQTTNAGASDMFVLKFNDCSNTYSTINQSVCDSFVFNNITYKVSGTYTQKLFNAMGCDSTITINLTIKKNSSILTQTGCDSLVINSVTYKTSGTYTQKLTNAAGCDSVVTLNLTINKSSSSVVTLTVCDSLVIKTVTYKNSGTYIQKITNAGGCDSTITLNLTIKKSSGSSINQTGCDSIVINGISYKSSGTFFHKKTNAVGCDSIITLNLTIKKSTSNIFFQSSCDSFVFNGFTYKAGGTYTQKRTNTAGCDSNIIFTLNIKKSTSSIINQTSCDSFILNNITYKTSGTYIQKRFNNVGCDSTITLNLTINKSSSSTLSQTACDSFVMNSITYKTSGIYTQKRMTASGCDSTITLNLTINKSSSSSLNRTACDSFVLNNITYKTSGTYNQKKTNAAGCDSNIILNLTVNKGMDAHFSATITNKSVTFIPLELNAKNYLWRFGNGDTSIQKIPVYDYLSSGNYLVKLKLISLQDCESLHDSTIAIQGNGIRINNNLSGIRLYPNPAKSEVTIYGLTVESTLTLIDALGKVISVTDSDKTNTISTSHLANGIYFINVSNEMGNVNLKLAIDN